jgi:prefoldin subunit 5
MKEAEIRAVSMQVCVEMIAGLRTRIAALEASDSENRQRLNDLENFTAGKADLRRVLEAMATFVDDPPIGDIPLSCTIAAGIRALSASGETRAAPCPVCKGSCVDESRFYCLHCHGTGSKPAPDSDKGDSCQSQDQSPSVAPNAGAGSTASRTSLTKTTAMQSASDAEQSATQSLDPTAAPSSAAELRDPADALRRAVDAIVRYIPTQTEVYRLQRAALALIEDHTRLVAECAFYDKELAAQHARAEAAEKECERLLAEIAVIDKQADAIEVRMDAAEAERDEAIGLLWTLRAACPSGLYWAHKIDAVLSRHPAKEANP